MTHNDKPKSDFLSSVLGDKPASDTPIANKPVIDKKSNDTMSNKLAKKVVKNVVDSVVDDAKAVTTSKLDDMKNSTLAQTLKDDATAALPHTPADLALAVVGHTNTGKTSLLRTLLRDSQFGEVKNAAATTKHVERVSIFDGTNPLVDLFDTPGLEDAGGLLDWLEDNTEHRADGVERLHTFLASDVADTDFNQEAKVLRQLLSSDVALYVVDTREPVLGKYKDELTVLSWCAKPLIPVFNFIHEVSTEQLGEWQDMLARRTLHVSTSFDTVAFDFDGEMQLWQNLATLLTASPKHNDTLTRLIDIRQAEWHELEENAKITIAHTLLNVAAYKREIDEDDDPAPVLMEMQEQVRQLERKLHTQLLELYRFYDNDIAPTELQLENYQRDPFDPELLKEYGIRTTSGAAAGAVLGLGIDAATFGASLGLGAAIGGVIGGVLSNVQTINDKLAGKQSLFIDPATVTLLATRAMDLLHALMHRGHADQSAITVNEQQPPWVAEKLPSQIKKARGKHAWSELNTQQPEQSKVMRDEAAWALARKLIR